MSELLTDLADFQYSPITLADKAGPSRISIAVLPFEDISPGKQNQYLADGMTEELITALSQNPKLRVIARTSVMPYKERAGDVRAIGQELGISHALEGSVRRLENRLRITAQLIDTEDGSHIWADKYDGVIGDIFGFQEEVAGKVIDALRDKFDIEPVEASAKAAPQTRAYELYLQGKFLLDVQTLPNLDRSVQLLERALRFDPDYPEAMATLACAYLWYVDTGLRPDPKYLSRAQTTAQKALTFDEGQADALYVLANLTMKRGAIEEAFKGFGKALETDPNHRDARLWRSILLCLSSCFDEALKEADRLLSFDPFWPMAHWIHSTIRMHQGRFDAAVAEYEQVITELTSKLVWLALAYRYAGRMDKAWAAADKVKRLEPDGVLWPIAFAFLEGAEGKGRKILEYVDDRVKAFGWDFHIATYWVASFYAMAGENEEALRWLERAIDIGNRNHLWFEIDPNLEPLRDDYRFAGVLEKARTSALNICAQTYAN
jgi:TolB-like protein/cytochrome c-type biogenesis protein CcmH/NrfG